MFRKRVVRHPETNNSEILLPPVRPGRAKLAMLKGPVGVVIVEGPRSFQGHNVKTG